MESHKIHVPNHQPAIVFWGSGRYLPRFFVDVFAGEKRPSTTGEHRIASFGTASREEDIFLVP